MAPATPGRAAVPPAPTPIGEGRRDKGNAALLPRVLEAPVQPQLNNRRHRDRRTRRLRDRPRYLIRPYYLRPDGRVGHDAFAGVASQLKQLCDRTCWQDYASGRVILHASPRSRQSKRTSPLSWPAIMFSIMLLPNPRRVGGVTGGPPDSIQLKLSRSSVVRDQVVSTQPPAADSEPYFAALVALCCPP
jgi:hypothetical protein